MTEPRSLSAAGPVGAPAARPATRPRVVIVTTFFPSPRMPHRTVFVRNLAQAMKAHCDLITVVAPTPTRPLIDRLRTALGKLPPVPMEEDYAGFALRHPRYASIPGVSWLAGLNYALGIVGTLRELQRRHGTYVIHAHCAFPDAVGVALAARWLGLRYVVTAHGSDINVYAQRALLKPQVAWALRGAAGVVAVSRALHERIAALMGPVPTPLRTVPCAGFNPELFFPRPASGPRAALGIAPAARIVVFVGLLVPIKGIEFLIEAWRLLAEGNCLAPADLLVIIGDGPERAALLTQAQAGGVAERVRFTGSLDQAAVSQWIAAANALCLPSRAEGMPNVVVEALASGVPVVASRVGGIPELVHDGVNGELVPVGQPPQLAQALARVMQANWPPEQVSRSVQHLTWPNIAARNCELFGELFSEPLGNPNSRHGD